MFLIFHAVKCKNVFNVLFLFNIKNEKIKPTNLKNK